jgi:hypothetical protein
MAAASPRATFSGSGLLRLLSDLGGAGGVGLGADASRPAGPSFAERLGLWLDWTDAIALSAALNANVATRPSGDAAAAAASTADACQRVRSDLVKLATADVGYTAAAAPGPAVDFAAHRRDYVAHQRAMESAIPPLRAQLRAALSDLTPEGARLAALDAVMDEALRPREKHLLASLPVWLEKHFEHLQQAQAGAAEGVDDDAGDGLALHHRYHRDMRRVLQAELDLRLQPVEGLLEALHHETRPRP